jgi:GTP-binding protein
MGLGDEFLKHIERTRLIVHLIDIEPLSGPAPAEAYKIIRNELASHSKALAEKPEIVVANKMDLSGAEQNLRKLRRKLGIEVIGISAVTGKNLKNLLKRIAEMLWPAQE